MYVERTMVDEYSLSSLLFSAFRCHYEFDKYSPLEIYFKDFFSYKCSIDR